VNYNTMFAAVNDGMGMTHGLGDPGRLKHGRRVPAPGSGRCQASRLTDITLGPAPSVG